MPGWFARASWREWHAASTSSPTAMPNPRSSLAEASARVPRGVICLTSALQFHELTPQMPSAVWIAIDHTGWKPDAEYPPIRFVSFSGESLAGGVKRHPIDDGIEVPIFEPDKSIFNCFRYRNKIGLDIALEGLREGLRGGRVTPDQLWEFVRTARAWSPFLARTSMPKPAVKESAQVERWLPFGRRISWTRTSSGQAAPMYGGKLVTV